MLTGVARVFSDDLAIDLGTANTLVYAVGRGIILDEPSVVAVRTRGAEREIVAVGLKAKALAGKTPEPVELLRPMRDGVIADFVATEVMLRTFIRRAKRTLGFRSPRILICVPAAASPVERRAVYETAMAAGARKVFLIEEPVAAALGAGLPIEAPRAFMVLDIGGGTSDIAVMRGGKVIASRSLRVAGNAMDDSIVRYVRREHGLIISESSAERIKIEVGTVAPGANGHDVEVHIKGRDVRERRQKSVVLGRAEIATALQQPVQDIADFVERSLDDLPGDAAVEVVEGGIVLTGGGGLLDGLDLALHARLRVRFNRPEAPLQSVVLGTAAVLGTLDQRGHLLLQM